MSSIQGGVMPGCGSIKLRIVYTTEPGLHEMAYDEPIWCPRCWTTAPYVGRAYHRKYSCQPRPSPFAP